MTDQTGAQPPAGWYPDGSGQVRYWDGAAWTEHVQPQQPEAPAAPATPAAAQQPGVADPTHGSTAPAAGAPAAPAAAAAAAGAAGVAAGSAAAANEPGGAATRPAIVPVTDPAAITEWESQTTTPQPFYRKPAGLAVLAVVLLLIIGGAVFALAGGGDDDEGAAPIASQAPTTAPAPQATSARQAYTLNCEPVSKIQGSNAPYPFILNLDVSPTAVTVTASSSVRNTGPTTIEVDKYRFDAVVTVNGAPLTLVGTATNKAEAAGDTGGRQPIFKADEFPLTATAALPAGTAGTPTVVLQDIYFNNLNNAPTGTDALTDTFDSRCNPSPTPNAAPQPIGLSVPPAAGGAAVPAPAPSVPNVAPSVAPSVPNVVPSVPTP